MFRPDTISCLVHPFFWDAERRLAFLQDASDRFEIMCREPREEELVALEKNASNVLGQDWRARLDKSFQENLGKFRKYDGKSVQDLLRALRNKVSDCDAIFARRSNKFCRNTIIRTCLKTSGDNYTQCRGDISRTSRVASPCCSCMFTVSWSLPLYDMKQCSGLILT